MIPEGYLELDFLEAGKLAFIFSILVCATHSLARAPCAAGKPAQRAFGEGPCGLTLRRTACASCPWLILQGNQPATSSPQTRTFVGVQFGAAQLLDVPVQRRENSPPLPGSIPRWRWVRRWAKSTQSVLFCKNQAMTVFQRLFLVCLLEELCGV